MKLSMTRLTHYLDTKEGVKRIAEQMTSIGFEVEHIEDYALLYGGFFIAELVGVREHPHADRLRLCDVNYGGDTTLTIVCGAPNVRVGLKTIFAPVGVTIPQSGVKIRAATIRQVKSHGMLCSAEELNLKALFPQQETGIVELPDSALPGESLVDYIGMNDCVCTVNVTPNRGDCLSVYGLARELAASGIGTLNPKDVPEGFTSMEWKKAPHNFFDPERIACAVFSMSYFKGNFATLPRTSLDTFDSTGLMAVDLCNQVMIDYGQPMHLYDADLIQGQLTVRYARTNEEFVALNGTTYRLSGSELVVCDEAGPVAIAGIIGAKRVACSQDTRRFALEVASWDPVSIARTGRALGIATEARYRYERGVDTALVQYSAQLALSRLKGVADQFVFEESLIQIGDQPAPRSEILFPLERIAQYTGMSIPAKIVRALLSGIGCELRSSDESLLTVTPPSWRPDLETAADLIEEVTRLYGYDNLKPIPLYSDEHANRTLDPQPEVYFPIILRTKRFMASRGFVETLTWSFYSEDDHSTFGGLPSTLKIKNPLGVAHSHMRRSVIPNLLDAVQKNTSRSFRNLSLFEVGPTFTSFEPDGQSLYLTAIKVGNGVGIGEQRHWMGNPPQADLRTIKKELDAVLSFFNGLSSAVVYALDAPSWYHPYCSGTVRYKSKVLGSYGQLHPKLLKQRGIDANVSCFELDLSQIPVDFMSDNVTRLPYVKYNRQPVERDFSFIIDAEVQAQELIRSIHSCTQLPIVGVSIFDVYESQSLADGKRSIGVSVTFQPKEDALCEAQIREYCDTILQSVRANTGATLRIEHPNLK